MKQPIYNKNVTRFTDKNLINKLKITINWEASKLIFDSYAYIFFTPKSSFEL